jgi:hypothetical protein
MDNGTPARQTAGAFRIVVSSTPVIMAIASGGGQASFSFLTSPGHLYRVVYKDELADAGWQQLGREFVATGPLGSMSDNMGAKPRRFYRVLQLD